MNIFGKQITRKWAFSTALTLLLALSVGFSCIGYSTWSSVQEQMNAISSEYTTIAVPLLPDEEYIREQQRKGWKTMDNGDIRWKDGTITYSRKNVEEVAGQAPQVLKVENSGLLSVRLVNLKGLSSGSIDPVQYNEAFDLLNYSFCVLAVKCIGVTDTSTQGYVEKNVSLSGGREGSVRYVGQTSYYADFEVVECLSLMEAYGDLTGKTIRIGDGETEFCLTEENGRIPFEEGKTYLVRGFFRDLMYKMVWGQAQKTQVEENIEEMIVRAVELCARGVYDSKDLSCVQYYLDESEMDQYYMPMEGSLPYYCEYTGTPQEFLNTAEGTVWRDTIIPWTRLNQNSAALVLTDNLYAGYNFNTGAASILEGRAFTEEEYAEGSDVCLVSASFAQHNNLAVGDTVTAELYDTQVGKYDIHVEEKTVSYNDFIYLRRPITADDGLNVQKSYRIVGIYTAPEFSDGQYNFTADTIFAPKKLVADAKQYEEPEVAYLNALILKGGSQEEFEAYMAKHDMGGYYTYLDMGYSEVSPALEVMEANAARLLYIGCTVFVLAGLVSFYLLANRMGQAVRGARLIGVRRGRIWRQTMTVFLGVVLAASLLGAAVGLISAEAVAGSVLAFAGMEVLFLVAVAGLVCFVVSGPNLMKSRGRRGRR